MPTKDELAMNEGSAVRSETTEAKADPATFDPATPDPATLMNDVPHLSEDDLRICRSRAQQLLAERASQADIAVVTEQLGRYPRGIISVAARCQQCGTPLVVATRPLITERVKHPTPFPTTFYLTSPEAVKAASHLESAGVMVELQELYGEEAIAGEAAAAQALGAAASDAVETADSGEAQGDNLERHRQYVRAHEMYLAVRNELARELGDSQEHILNISAGGMPTRVKCLHALVGHALAMGPGVNPVGDEALRRMKHEFDPAVCRCTLKVADFER